MKARPNSVILSLAATLALWAGAGVWLLTLSAQAEQPRAGTTDPPAEAPGESAAMRRAVVAYAPTEARIEESLVEAGGAFIEGRIYDELAAQLGMDAKTLREKLPPVAAEWRKAPDATLHERASAAYVAKDFAEAERLALQAAQDAGRATPPRTGDAIKGLELAGWSAVKGNRRDPSPDPLPNSAHLYAAGEFALEHFRAAAALTDRARNPLEWARVQYEIASALINNIVRSDEALPILREIAQVRGRALGPEHPDTLASRTTLDNLLHDLDMRDFARYGLADIERNKKGAAAEKEYRAVLAIRERVLGPEHPDTLNSRCNLAKDLAWEGKYAEAEKQYRAVLAVRERVLGPEHPNTLFIRSILGDALNDADKHAEAEAEHRAVLAIRERVLGPEHPDTLTSRHKLAAAIVADPDEDIIDTSPDLRFGFRYSFAKDSEAEEWDRRIILAIDIVEILSKRVVLRWPKDALTPIHLGDMSKDWSSDSKHVTLNYQTGPRTWTTKLYEWDRKEFVEDPLPRDAIGKRIEEEQAAQLKALGLPETTPRKLVHEGFTVKKNRDNDDATAVDVIVERIDSVVISKDLPPAELDARFRFSLKIREPGKVEITNAAKIVGTSGTGDDAAGVEARLVDEQPESYFLVKDVEEGAQPFPLYVLERFSVMGEKGDDFLIRDDIKHRGRIPRRLVHMFPIHYSIPSPFSFLEIDQSAQSFGIHYEVLRKAAQSGSLPALRAFFALPGFDGQAGEGYQSHLIELRNFVSTRQYSEALGSFSARFAQNFRAMEKSWSSEPSKSSAVRQAKLPDFSKVLAKADACARLVDESLTAAMEVTSLSNAKRKSQLHGGEYFAIIGEEDGGYVIQDASGNQGRVAKDFVEKVPKPATESAMLLPVMGIHYLRVVKGTQNQDSFRDYESLMLSLDLTGQSGAIHSGNLERMLDGNDETRQAVLKEFSTGRLKAIGAMLLQGRDEKEKVRLMKKYPRLFPEISSAKRHGNNKK